MDFGLDGCTAVVSGASSGMGRATAATLASEGCNVVLFARRQDVLEDAVAGINRACGAERAHAVAGDVTDPAALEQVVEVAQRHFGGLDIVVNNAGGPPAGGFDDIDDGGWQAAFELTVQSALRLTRHALPALRASGRGRIVNITSSAVKETSDGLLLTNALRPAIIGWAKAFSRDEARNGVTVNSIAPGYTDTERMKYLYILEDDPAAARTRDEEMIPAGRFADPSEMAAAIAFLCSTQAAYITGVTLLIDGGLARGLLS